MARTRELLSVQFLRAAACLLVVVYHTLQAVWGDAAIAAWPNGSAGVDLFFVISGFVMVTSTRRLAGNGAPARYFLARRAARLVPLYWLLTGVKFAITRAAPGLTPHTRPDAWNLIASLLFIPARDLAGQIRPVLPVGWSLNFEVLFYALFAVALAARLPVAAVVPPLLAIATAGLFRSPAWPAPLFLANPLVLEFALGMAVAAYAPRFAVSRRIAWALLAIAALMLLIGPLAGVFRCCVWGLPAACILLCAVTLEAAGGRVVRASGFAAACIGALAAIGDASYAIYLVHPFVIPKLASCGPVGEAACLPLSVAAGLCVHHAVDAPLQRGAAHWRRRAAVA